MPDQSTTIEELKNWMQQFVEARAWQRYHTPKNLVMGLMVEAGELMEHFLWMENAECRQYAGNEQKREAIADELADVACYVLAIANAIDLDLSAAIWHKLGKNAEKYPVEDYQGRYRLDTDLPHK